MAEIKLGLNACFAVARFPEPEVWLEIVGKKFDLRYTQFFSDLIDPKVEEETKKRLCARTKEAAKKYGVTIHSVFSGTGPHWCHFLLHPDEGMRKDAAGWWENYIRMTPLLGSKAVGSLLGSLSVRDLENPERKKMLIGEVVDRFHHFSRMAKEVGLEYLMFEPMSVPREVPSTIAETEELYEKMNDGAALPVKLCMDVGHGAVCSGTKDDRDPYAWLRRFAARAPVIHIQQTDGITSKHWPFTEEHNQRGIIKAEKVIEAIEESGADEVLLVIEIFHSFYEPMDNQVLEDLATSVEYWKKHL